MSGGPTPATGARAENVQLLSRSRIQRAEGTVLSVRAEGTSLSSQAAPSSMRTVVASATGTAVPSVAPQTFAASLQPRVVPMEQAPMVLIDSQTSPMVEPPAVSKEAKLLPTQTMQTSGARLLDIKRSPNGLGFGSTQSAAHQESWEQTEAERNAFIRSMQETHTLQIRMLEELIEQKVAKVFEALTAVSSQCEERFAHTEAHRLDMKGDVDALHAHVMKLPNGQLGVERTDTRGDMLDAMANLQSDFEAIRHQHHGALNAIQAQSEEHRQLHSLHEDVRQKLDSVHQVHEQRQGELKMQLHSELSDIRHEINLLASQQRHHGAQLQELSDLHREINQQGLQQRQQGAQLQELEAQVVQHLQGLKEEQQNEAQLLRQDLEATLAANSHGEGMMELQRKYEDVSRAVEVALRELPTERQAAPSLDRLESLEAERQERAREISSLLESLEGERQERIAEMSNLASFLQDEKQERIQIDEELDARQQQASQETYQAVNQAFDEFRAEMRALADQMIRQAPDSAEIESMVAKALRPERDARLEFTRCLETERGTRVQDIENEREARVRESTDLREAIQGVSTKLEALNEVAMTSSKFEKAEVEPDLHHRVEVLSESHRDTQSQLGQIDAQVRAMERDHAEHVSSLRKEISELHDGTIESASTLRVLSPEMDPASDVAALRGEVAAMRARVDALSACELPSERMPEQSMGHSIHQDFDAISTALEEETAKRCEASAELHARITREAAEVSSRMELLWQELQEAISAEGEERRTDIDAIRRITSQGLDPQDVVQSASSTATRVADRALELAQSLQEEIRAVLEREHAEVDMRMNAEQTARLREINTCRTELVQAVEQERLGRAAQNDEVRIDLMKAIAVERDERIAENSDQRAEILKMFQSWRQGQQVSSEAVQEEMQRSKSEEAQESPGFITRFFRSSRAMATE